MHVVSLIGGRPNLIKSSPIHKDFINEGIKHSFIDINLFTTEFGKKLYSDLGLPNPVEFLSGVNEDYSNRDIYNLAIKIKHILNKIEPNKLLVYGDLSPGVSGVIAGYHLGIPLYHIEAGLRNYNLSDPEEINRIIIDKFSSCLFTTSQAASNNLLSEGYPEKIVHVSGNTVIDALKDNIDSSSNFTLGKFNLKPQCFGIITINRKENLESNQNLREIIKSINAIQTKIDLIFIQYESTLKAFARHGLQESLYNLKRLHISSTISYHDFLGLLQESSFVITDSSDIQDETTYLGIPCITCREATHRADSLEIGTNKLVRANAEDIEKAVDGLISGKANKNYSYPHEWDMRVSEKIISLIKEQR